MNLALLEMFRRKCSVGNVPNHFEPAWWCLGAHAQTIAGALLRPKPGVSLTRKRIDTPDGDFLDLDFLSGNLHEPTVVILHGLEGSSQAPNVQSLLGEIRKRGFPAVAVNMRMCSGEPNRLSKTYHSGKTEDLDFVLRYLKEKERREKLFLAGFSIGGNILLKWLGEQGSAASPLVEKAACVSVPYDLEKSVELMDRGFNREIYTRALLARLKEKAFAKKRLFPDAIRYERIKACRTFRVFDDEATAKLNGFANAADYWTRASCRPFLERIRVPTLLIHAADDPFFPEHLLPFETFQKNHHLQPVITKSGGHLGFVAGRCPWKWEFWLEKKIMDFFQAV